MPLRGALRKKLEREKRPATPRERAIQNINTKGKGEWFLDIITAVFILGVLANVGINFQNVFFQEPSFQAMQTFLLFAILLQLVKIGKKL